MSTIVGVESLSLNEFVTSCSLRLFVKVDEKSAAAINPDEYSKGVMHWHKEKKMDDLMEFLSCYVRNIHADRYLKNLLLNTPGYTYLDIITLSDIAYVISLIKIVDICDYSRKMRPVRIQTVKKWR